MTDLEMARICKVHLDSFRLFVESNNRGHGLDLVIAYSYVRKAIEALEKVTDKE